MAPPRKFVPNGAPSQSSRKGKGVQITASDTVGKFGKGPVVTPDPPVVPEDWQDIKNIEQCLWTTADVLDRPSTISNAKKLRVTEGA